MQNTIRIMIAALALSFFGACAHKEDTFVCGGTGKTCVPVKR